MEVVTRTGVNGGSEMARSANARAWARGGTVFAATIMVIIGIFQILIGIAAIAQDQFFVVQGGADNYAYNLDTTAWGWAHLGVGVIVALTGFFLFSGATAARVVGIIIAGLSAIANFAFIPYQPFWALLVIALDIFVIWSLAATRHTDRLTEGELPSAYYDESAQMAERERWTAMNEPAGRHYAEPPKAGTREAAEAQRQAAMSGGQQQSGQQPGQNPQGGNPQGGGSQR